MRISVRDAQSLVKNQSDRPTCVSFAATALHEHEHDVIKASKTKAEIDLSEEFLHYHCKKRDGLGATRRGTTVCAAAASLAAEGQCSEDHCLYQASLKTSGLLTPTSAALIDGRARICHNLKPLAVGSDSILRCLRADRPMIGVLDWYSNAYFAPGGVIELPRVTDRLLGRHAVLIVEWDDGWRPGNPCIGFKNSWGPKWGDKGFGRFGVDYFETYGRELWGSIDRKEC